jgi:hypothetical protein
MPKNKPKDTAEDATPAPKKRNKKRHAGPSALVTNSMGTSAKAKIIRRDASPPQ